MTAIDTLTSLDAVFFDMDGTLVDTFAAERRCIAALMEERGIVPLRQHVDTYRMLNLRYWTAYGRGEIGREELLVRRFLDFFATIGHPLNGRDEASGLDARYQELLGSSVEVMDGAVALLEHLTSRVTLLLATNAVLATTLSKLRTTGLDRYFSVVAASETVGFQKPERGFFRAAMAQCGLTDPSRILMVGDLWHADIRGAADAGLRTCWFNPAGAPVPDGENLHPDLTVASLTELLTLWA